MPSPTERTWPTSLTSASVPKFWISRFRIAEISAGWMFILLSSHGGAKPIKLRTQRRIDHARTHFHDETAEKRRIDLGIEPRVAAELGFENGFEFVDFAVAQRARRSHLSADFTAQLGRQKFEGTDNVHQREEAALAREQQHEAHCQRRRFHTAQNRVHAFFLLLAGKDGRANQKPKVRAFIDER